MVKTKCNNRLEIEPRTRLDQTVSDRNTKKARFVVTLPVCFIRAFMRGPPVLLFQLADDRIYSYPHLSLKLIRFLCIAFI